MFRRSLPVAALLLGVGPVAAQTEAPPPHLSVLEGRAEIARGADREAGRRQHAAGSRRSARDDDGRAEVLLGDGSALHLDERTTVDFNGDTVVRLVNGRLIVLAERGAAGTLQIDAAPASVRVQSSAEVHLALLDDRGQVTLQVAVVRGLVDVDSGNGPVAVRAGQQVFVREGEAPSYPEPFNSARLDGFARWSQALFDGRRGATSAQYLPADVRVYGSTFDQYGSWSYDAPYGYVWYPRVAASWRPYYHGRWRHAGHYGWNVHRLRPVGLGDPSLRPLGVELGGRVVLDSVGGLGRGMGELGRRAWLCRLVSAGLEQPPGGRLLGPRLSVGVLRRPGRALRPVAGLVGRPDQLVPARLGHPPRAVRSARIHAARGRPASSCSRRRRRWRSRAARSSRPAIASPARRWRRATASRGAARRWRSPARCPARPRLRRRHALFVARSRGAEWPARAWWPARGDLSPGHASRSSVGIVGQPAPMNRPAWRCREAFRPNAARCPDLQAPIHGRDTENRQRRARPTAARRRRTRGASSESGDPAATRSRPSDHPDYAVPRGGDRPGPPQDRAPRARADRRIARPGLAAVSTLRSRPRIARRGAARDATVGAVAPRRGSVLARSRRPGGSAIGLERRLLVWTRPSLDDATGYGTNAGRRDEYERTRIAVHWRCVVAHYVVRLARRATIVLLFVLAVRAGRVQRPAVRVGRRPAADLRARRLRTQHHHARLRLQGRDHRRVRHRAPDRRAYEQISPLLRQAIISAEDQTFEDHLGVSIPRIVVTAVKDIVRPRALRRQHADAATGAQPVSDQREDVGAKGQGSRSSPCRSRSATPSARFSRSTAITCRGGMASTAPRPRLASTSANRPRTSTLEEAALLAGIVQSPARQSPYVSVERATRRRNYALQRMADEGYISAAQAARAKQAPVVTAGRPATGGFAPFFVEDVRQHLEERYGAKRLYQGGLAVHTSLDAGASACRREGL